MLFVMEVPESVNKLEANKMLMYLVPKYRVIVEEALLDNEKWKHPSQFVAEMLEIPEPNQDVDSIVEAILSSDLFLTRLWEKDDPSDQNNSSQQELREFLNPGLEAIVRLLREE